MISGSESAEVKRDERCSEGEKGSRESEGKFTSEPGDVSGHSLLLLNYLIVIKGKTLPRELQISFDSAVSFEEGLEGGGPKGKSLLKAEMEVLA